MKFIAILLCFSAFPAFAENDPQENPAPEIQDRTTTISIDKHTCIELGGQLMDVWENARSVFYICVKADKPPLTD